MKVLKNYFYNAGYQLLIILVPLITTPYVNRVLGPYGIGVNTYTNTIIQYFILIGSLGISLYGNRQIAYVRDNKYELSRQFWEIQIVHILGIVLASVIFIFYWFFIAKYKIFMLIQAANLIAALFDISWFYQGLENFKLTVLKNTIVKLISIFLIFLFVRSYKDVGIYIFIYSISTLLGNLTLWPALKSSLVKINFKKLNPWKHISPSIALFIPTVAVQIYQTFNKTLLGIFSGVASSGYYFNADTIIKMLLYLITAIGTVMLPHTAHAYAKGDTEHVKQMLQLSANITSCLTIAFAFGIAAVASNFVPLFFGQKFTAVGPAIMLESPIIYFAGLSSVIGTQYLIPTNQVKPYSFSLILGAIISLILDLILIPSYGLIGAIISTVSAELIVLLYQSFFVIKQKQLEYRDLYSDLVKYLFSGIVMFIVVVSIKHTFSVSFYNIILQILCGAFVYGILISVFQTKAFKVLCDLIKHNLLD